jgi:hypothetical protein
MHARVWVAFVSMILLPAAGAAQADSLGAAQADSLGGELDRGHAHILHVSDVFEGTPGGQGLLRIALAEGEIAALHAELATEAANSLSDVRLHVGHMLHALDPAIVFEGPGLGYGLRRATEESLQHVEMGATSEGASDNLRTHAAYIGATLRAVLNRADRMVDLARDIQLATSVSAAAPLLARLNELGSALVPGRDLDRDHLVGWQGEEGGLRQAAQHMTLLKRGEGLLTGP